MANREKTSLSNKQLNELFKLQDDGENSCRAARMFFGAVEKVKGELSGQNVEGEWAKELDWPTLFQEFREQGGFWIWNQEALERCLKGWFDTGGPHSIELDDEDPYYLEKCYNERLSERSWWL